MIYRSRTKRDKLIHRLPLNDTHSRANHLLPSCRIEERGIDPSIFHGFQTGTRHGINADNPQLPSSDGIPCHKVFPGGYGHHVVMGVNEIYLLGMR